MPRARGFELRKRPNSPNWRVRFTDRHGLRVERSTGTPILSEAREVAAKIHAQEFDGRVAPVPVAPSGAPLKDLLAEWLTEVEDLRSAHWTSKLIEYSRRWLDHWSTLEELLAPGAIQAYQRVRLAAPGRRGSRLRPTTLHKELVGLRRFLKWCVARGRLEVVPKWEAPKAVSDHVPLHLTRSQVDAVLAELPNRTGHRRGHPVREYFTVLWALALRRDGLQRLRWEDVNLAQGRLNLRATGDKNRFGRALPIPPEAAEALASLPREGELVFGRRNFVAALQAAGRAAGLPEEVASRLSDRVFRHSRLTELGHSTSNIAAVQYVAGHKHLATTSKYVHGSFEAARDILFRDATQHVEITKEE